MASNMMEYAKSQYAAMTAEKLKQTGADAANGLMMASMQLATVSGNMESSVALTLKIMISSLKLGFNTRYLSQKQKQFLRTILPKNLIDISDSVSESITQEDYNTVNAYNVLLQNGVPASRTVGDSSFKLLMCAAYIDGSLSNVIAEKIDAIFGMVLFGIFADSGLESVPAPAARRPRVTGLEARVLDYMLKQKTMLPLDDIAEAFPGETKAAVKKALDGLCEKELVHWLFNVIGEPYSADVKRKDVEIVLSDKKTSTATSGHRKLPKAFVISKGVLKEYNGTDEQVKIPDGVTRIGDYAFSCKSMQSVTIPDGVTCIGDHAFYGCKNLQSVTIPDSVTNIGDGVFQRCERLQSVTIPDGVTCIGKDAFSWCDSLQSVAIPDSVTNIGDAAFSCCGRLQNVTIPDGVTNIGDAAFSCCERLQNVTIPDGVTNIGKGAFFGCAKLADADGFVIVQSVLYGYYGSNSSVIIPDGVTIIDYCAFFKKRLQSVTIPDSVTSIGDKTFYECHSLQSVTIPDSVTSIGVEAFFGCKSLQSVAAKANIKKIGKNAFAGCGSLALRIGDKKKRAAFLKKHGFSEGFLEFAEENALLPFADVLPVVLGPILAYPFDKVQKKDCKNAALDTYGRNPAVISAVKKLDHAALMELLKLFIAKDDPKIAARWYAPYAAYADDAELEALLAEMNEWEKDKKKQEQLIRVRGAVLLNENDTAMHYAESLGLLDRYTKLHSTDTDELPDFPIGDFGAETVNDSSKPKNESAAERKAREAEELRAYEKAVGIWKQEMQKTETARKNELAGRRKARMDELAKQYAREYAGAKAAADQALAAAQKKKAQAEETLSSLGLFKLNEKKTQRALIAEAEEEIQKAEQALAEAESKKEASLAGMVALLDQYMETQIQDVERRFPLPIEPKKPKTNKNEGR